MKPDTNFIHFITDFFHYLVGIAKAFTQIVFIFLMPVKLMILSVVIVGTVDTYFGIRRSKKDGKPYSSKTFRIGYIVNKVIMFALAVILTYLLDYIALDGLFKLLVPIDNLSTKLVTLAIVWNEVQSIDESWVVIKGYSFLGKFKDFAKGVLNLRKKIKEDGI